MSADALLRRHPVPTLVTGLLGVVVAVTAAYYAGLVPGVPKTLPTFVKLLAATVALLVAAALSWAVSLL